MAKVLLREKRAALFLAIFVLFLILGGAVYYLRQKGNQIRESSQNLLGKQKKELEALRNEAGAAPLGEKEVKKQVEELDILRGGNAAPFSEKEIQKQLEELDNLRGQHE